MIESTRPYGIHRMTATLPLDDSASNLYSLRLFQGREAMSELFEFKLHLSVDVARINEVKYDQVVGKPIKIELEATDATKRYVHGFVREFAQIGRGVDTAIFEAIVVPKFWFWTLTRRSRIFQNQSVVETLRAVLIGLDINLLPDPNNTRTTVYARHNYCVQYDETDYEFAVRIMHQEGLFFYFRHTNEKHELVIEDASTKCPQLDGTVPFLDTTGGSAPSPAVRQWFRRQKIGANKTVVRDSNFELPDDVLESVLAGSVKLKAGDIEHTLQTDANKDAQWHEPFAGHGKYFDSVDSSGTPRERIDNLVAEDARRLARLRQEEIAARAVVASGVGNVLGFSAGHSFTLAGHYDSNDTYLLLEVEHHIAHPGQGSSLTPECYHNRFSCTLKSWPFRAPRLKKPNVSGVHSATVIAIGDDEISTDKYGRVKVEFHWDTGAESEISCWVRVSENWAGTNWGTAHAPRIGQEVLVAYIEGDIDRPVIVGRVYNSATMPPYDMTTAGGRATSGIKTRSKRDGAATNYNELRFYDLKGTEHVNLHAERDLYVQAERIETHNIGNYRETSVGDTPPAVDDPIARPATINTPPAKEKRDESLQKMYQKWEQLKDANGNLLWDTKIIETRVRTGRGKYKTVRTVQKDPKMGWSTVNVAGKAEGSHDELYVKGWSNIYVSAWSVERVAGDSYRWVSGNDKQTFDKDQTVAIAGKQTIDVTGDYKLTVGGSFKQKYTADEWKKTEGWSKEYVNGGKESFILGGDFKQVIGGTSSIVFPFAHKTIVGFDFNLSTSDLKFLLGLKADMLYGIEWALKAGGRFDLNAAFDIQTKPLQTDAVAVKAKANATKSDAAALKSAVQALIKHTGIEVKL